MENKNTMPALTKRERAQSTGKYRTPMFEETITLALSDAGIDIPYKEFEQALHGAMGSFNHLPWWRYSKYAVFEKERNATGGDGFENVAFAVAGAAIGMMGERGITDNSDRVAVMRTFLDSFSAIVEQGARRQWEHRGSEMFAREPLYFSEIEGTNSESDEWDIDTELRRMGGRLLSERESPEIDGKFEDPRLQALWDAADEDEREIMRDIAAGVSYRQASFNAGFSGGTAREKLKQKLPRKVGLVEKGGSL